MRVGRLGYLSFDNGIYAYVGSAQNNLKMRVARHFRKKKRIFWHIDHLLSSEHAKILEVFFKVAPKAEECRTAETLRETGEAIRGFGSSDCRCVSHLLKVSNYERLKWLIENMNFMKVELEKLV
ncbi:MAG: GIY-YIG nuclease family protein [Candidatus Bathyarchaeia archaeon]